MKLFAEIVDLGNCAEAAKRFYTTANVLSENEGVGALPASVAGIFLETEILVRLLPEQTRCIEAIVALYHSGCLFDRMVRN